MSRHDGGLDAASEADRALVALLLEQLPPASDGASRQAAMACFLSGSDGWRDAAEKLGGTFAGGVGEATGLTPGKER